MQGKEMEEKEVNVDQILVADFEGMFPMYICESKSKYTFKNSACQNPKQRALVEVQESSRSDFMYSP